MLTSLLMTARDNPYTYERFPATSPMHRFFTILAFVTPSPRLYSDTRSDSRPAVWHRVGFAGVMYALVGCATAPAPVRSVVDARPTEAETVAMQTPGSGKAPPAAAPVRSEVDVTSNVGSPRPDLPMLSPSHIGAAVRAHHSDFQACQALGDVIAQREDGAVTVGWAVKANGSVNHVTLGTSTFANNSINACILGVARQVTFPPSASPAHVSWTVKFRGAAHGPLADATFP
jgi:heme A synthase